MIVIVCGGRHFTDGEFLFAEMDRIHAELPITKVVEGGQRTWNRVLEQYVGGADFFAREWAKKNDIETKCVEAKWFDLSHGDRLVRRNSRGREYDVLAGARRNQEMIDAHKPDRVIAFSPSGRGTADMVAKARRFGIPVIERRAP